MKVSESLKKGEFILPKTNQVFVYNLDVNNNISIKERNYSLGDPQIIVSNKSIKEDMYMESMEQILLNLLKEDNELINDKSSLEGIEFGHIPKQYEFNNQKTTDCLVYSQNEQGEYQFILGDRQYAPLGYGLLGGMVEEGEEENNSLLNMTKELNEEANIEMDNKGLKFVAQTSGVEVRGDIKTSIYTKEVEDVTKYIAGSDMKNLNIVNMSELIDLMESSLMVQHHKDLINTIIQSNEKIKKIFETEIKRKENIKQETKIIKMITKFIKQKKYSLEQYIESGAFTLKQYKKYRIKAEEEIFWVKLGSTSSKLKKEFEEKGLDLPEFIIDKYFSTKEDEEKVRKQINKMRDNKLEMLAEATEEELEKVIQEILKEENIDITKNSEKLNEEIIKVVKNKFQGI